VNVEIGAEAALFPEKEYINGIAVAVHAETLPLIFSAARQKPIVKTVSAYTKSTYNITGLQEKRFIS
jgi:hypothetical protein